MPKASLVEGVRTAHVDMDAVSKRKRPAFDRFTGIPDPDPTVTAFLHEIDEKAIGDALFLLEEKYLRDLGIKIPILTEISQNLACGRWPDITLDDGSKINSADSIRKWYYDSVSEYHRTRKK